MRNLKFVPVVMVALAVLAGCGGDGSSSGATGSTSSDSSSGTGSSGSGSGTSTAGSATLRWSEPTSNTNGTPLTDLAGYRIYYGESASNLSETVQVNGATDTTYVLSNLTAGTWYFAIQSVTTNGVASALSDVVSITIS